MTTTDRPKITLLISTYNWVDALKRVLEGVLKQTILPNEIVIADDGSRSDTKLYIDSIRKSFPMPIVHVWHEDDGFRKTIILNKAIALATGEYIIEIDGDVIPERHFIQDHIDVMRSGYFVCGSRVMLQSDGSVRPSHYVNTFRCRLFRKLIATHKPKFSVRHVLGCNFAFWRADFIAVNGYNEDIVGWGHEDIELVFRLMSKGIKERRLKFGGVVRHIYHRALSMTSKSHNFEIQCNTERNHSNWCSNGISKYLQKRGVLILIALLLCVVSPARQIVGDSVSLQVERFHPCQLILPGALIAIGSFGVSNGWFCSVKNDVREGFQDLRDECRFKVDDHLQYLSVVANVGFGLIGAKTCHSFRERVAATATAYAALGVMVNVTKYVVSEKRPDSGALNSFPSGHTATAFMGAELVREEYGVGYGIGAYSIAVGIAFLRLYNDRHWLNDIIAGAGIGILSARIGYWLLPWERKIFGWNRRNTSVSLIPVYNPKDQSAGVSLVAIF